MTPPPGVQCLLFLQFYLYFLIFDKKNLTHPKMTKKFFFAFFTLFHPHLEFFNYLQKQKSYSHQGRPDWQHFWVKPAISEARKALLGTKNQKSCFLFFICMGHKYNISDFQPNRWFCLSWGMPLHLKWPLTKKKHLIIGPLLLSNFAEHSTFLIPIKYRWHHFTYQSF